MNRAKRRRLKAKGWRVGSAKSFLRIPRKLKKKYKKIGIWSTYLAAGNYLNSPTFVEIRRKAFEDLVLYGECRVDLGNFRQI